MKQQRSWMDRLTEGLDISADVNMESIVEMAGDRRVLIEHHRGIRKYQPDCIIIKVKFGAVAVCGCGMEIARMTKEQLVITGRIDSVTVQRRKT